MEASILARRPKGHTSIDANAPLLCAAGCQALADWPTVELERRLARRREELLQQRFDLRLVGKWPWKSQSIPFSGLTAASPFRDTQHGSDASCRYWKGDQASWARTGRRSCRHPAAGGRRRLREACRLRRPLHARRAGFHSATASTTTHSRNTPMLMRSHTPTHGVGRLAATLGASSPVSAPNTARITMVAME